MKHPRQSRSYFDLDQLIASNYSGEEMNTKKKSKALTKFIEKSLTDEYSKICEHVNIPEKIEGLSCMAWYLCNKKHQQIPSEYYPDGIFNLKMLDHLHENGSLVYSKIYDADSDAASDIGYVFEYKDYYLFFSCSFGELHPNGAITSLGILYSIHTKIDMDMLSNFQEKKKETPKIGIIKTNKYGPAVTWIEHKTDLKFHDDNYNEDFSGFFVDLKTKLTDNKTGLYLFYGEAGTGKSSAIRHLISEMDRPVVFIPPQMINCLSNPDFTDLVLNSLKGSILVIEDAEKALMKRENEDGFHNSELVSSLLNLTDGLYADLAHTSIIATYNCDRNLIDPALLRKGRLRSEYHFQKLSIDRSQKLMDDLKHDVKVTEPMTLADIFNYDKQYTNKKTEKKRAVGFGG